MIPPQCRNLFNIDCNCLFWSVFPPLREGEPFTAKILHDYVDLLADGGIDTVLMNATGQIPWYPSKALAHVITGYSRGDGDFVLGHFPPLDETFTAEMRVRVTKQFTDGLDRFLDLVEAGVDWLAEIAAACRRRALTPWVSVRMNDMHGANSWENSFMNCPPQRDPRCRLSGRQPNPRDDVNRMHTSVNYECAEVRDYMLAAIREVVQDYDYEGLELDWLRSPFCCEPPASPEAVALMTDWTAQVRELTQEQARKTGRPYPIGLRIPPRLGLLKAIGLDVVGMAERGLIDWVAPSNFWQTTWDLPYDELRRRLPESVAILGVVEAAPNWMNVHSPSTGRTSHRLLPTSAELLRGNAAGKLALGVDAIEHFNFFCADETSGRNPDASKRQGDYAALRGLADLEGLRGKPKQYALASAEGLYVFPLFEAAEQVPQVIEPEGKQAFRLSMCREPADCGLALTIQVVVEKGDALPDLGVCFNGSWPNFEPTPTDELLLPTGIFTHHIPEHQAFNYAFDAGLIQEGWNEVVVINGSHASATPEERRSNSVRIVSVELALG
jgi:hypothetical protein